MATIKRGRIESRTSYRVTRVAVCGVCGREQALSTGMDDASEGDQLARLRWRLTTERGWVCDVCEGVETASAR